MTATVFGLLEAKTAGKPIPGDVAYDAKGNSTTDPAEALKGAIRVFDRYHMLMCWSADQSISRSVGLSVRRSVGPSVLQSLRAVI